MKILRYLSVLLVLGLLVVGCKESVSPEDAAKLKEAGELHDASLAAGNEVNEMLAGAESLITQVEAIVPTIEDQVIQQEADSYITGISDAMNDYDLWKESLVEVPGHAHDHSAEGHSHNHDHSMDDASAEEVLAKQAELKEYIEDIKNRLTKSIEMAQSVIDEYGEVPEQ